MGKQGATLPTFRPEHKKSRESFGGVGCPKSEARGLLELLRTGETIAGLRTLIGTSPERRSTLREFDLLVLRLPKHPERQRKLRLRKKCNGSALSVELRAEVIGLLKAGVSHKNILAKLPVGPGIITALSKQTSASNLKKGGRGRRFTPETWKQILTAVKTGRPSRDIEREFRCDYVSVLKARKEVGDFENRRLRLKITPQQITQAESLLRSGENWRNVARIVGLSPTTVIKHCKYRKHADPNSIIKLSREKRDAIVAALHAGKSRHSIRRELHANWRTINKLWRNGGFDVQTGRQISHVR